MKYLIILYFSIFTVASAQTVQLKGSIVDSESSMPLSKANILLEGTSTGATTNNNGSFILSGIDKDQFLLITFVGYHSKRVKATDLDGQTPAIIKLEPKIISSQTVLVSGSVAKEGITPVAFSKVTRKEIQANYISQDIPEYLSGLPSTTFYSENGNGVGYNYLSIRGFDQRRISVSINGIPQNDPEDQNIYWLDFPDILGSTELIQVQRGAGSGIIGYPSVGGSINIITSSFSDKPKFDIQSSVGSYNTRKYSASFSSGLIDNKYSIYAKLSKILSDGYRDKSWSDFNAYHISAVRYDKDFTTQINFYGGPVSDGLAYNGLPKFAIKDNDLRKKNYSYWEASGNNISYSIERRVSEIENFSQPHFELLNEWNISNNISFNSALFMVTGSGFFDYDASWADSSYFRLTSENGFNPAVNPGNALVRAQVDNKQYGWIPRVSIKHDNGEFIAGAELRIHRSQHWGGISFAENLPAGLDKDYRYYQYNGGKDIINAYLHENYSFDEKFNLLAEAQLSYNRYLLNNEKYAGTDFSVGNIFFNPRVGINYKITPEQNIFLSFARVGKEPRLTNYYDAAESGGGSEPQFEKKSDGSFDFSKPLVKPEFMNDIEAGASLLNEKYSVSLNLFYMIFQNEIVKNGQIDRFGQPMTGNADKTIHYGIELSCLFHITNEFDIALNGTLSKNYINNGLKYIEYKDAITNQPAVTAIDLSGNSISGFPNTMFNASFKYNEGGLLASLNGKFVGRFYSDNLDKNIVAYLTKYPGFIDYSDNLVDAYFTADAFLSYELKDFIQLNSLRIFAQSANIFNNLYAAYAVGGGFFPAAERSFTVGIQLGL
ncbi:MAG: TonB-dependent receptor [Ignavibacteria bacterium]